MRRLLTCLLLPLAVPGADKPPAPGISVTFRALAFSGPIPDAAYAISENERIPLLISSDFMTAEQHYHGPATLAFTHLSKDLTETPLATATLADQSRIILLFVPDGGGHAVKVLRDVEGDFPWGTLRFVNLTGNRVRLVSGGSNVTLDNGADRTVRPSAGHKQYAMTEVLTERADGFARGYMLRTFQEDDLRALYFLLPADPREHTVVIKGVEERKGDERTAPPKPTPVTLKPAKDDSGKVANGKPVAVNGAVNGKPLNGQPKDARR